MEKIKQILSPSRDTADKEDTHGTDAPRSEVKDVQPESDQSSAPALTGTTAGQTSGDSQPGSDIPNTSAAGGTGTTAVGETTVYSSYPLRKGDNTSIGNTPNYSGNQESSMAGQEYTGAQAMTEGFSQPLHASRDTTIPLRGSKSASEARSDYGSAAPGGLPAEERAGSRPDPVRTEDSGYDTTKHNPIPGSFPGETSGGQLSTMEPSNAAVESQNVRESSSGDTFQPVAPKHTSTTERTTSSGYNSGPYMAATSNPSQPTAEPMTGRVPDNDTPSSTNAARNFSTPTTTAPSSREPTTAAVNPPGERSRGVNSLADESPEKNHDTAKYAAMGGVAAAGAGAGAFGGYEYSRQKPESGERDVLADDYHQRQQPMAEDRHNVHNEDKAHEKAMAMEEKKVEKDHDKAIKKEEKKAEKEEKRAEKEHEKAEKQHEKAVKKEEKKAEKDYMKAVKADEKRLENEHAQSKHFAEVKNPEDERAPPAAQNEEDSPRDSEDQEKKKKGGILGLFRRRRDSKGNEMDDENEDDSSRSPTAVGGHAAKDNSHQDNEKRHGMKKLTKSPPAGLYSGDSATPAHADYAVKENDHPGAQTIAGGYTAPDPKHDPHKYHDNTGGGSSMPATEHSQHGHYPADKQRHVDAKMRGQDPETRYDDGAGGVAPAVYAQGASGVVGGRESTKSSKYQRPTGGAPTDTDDRDIVMHSDGTRRYADGSHVDPPSQHQQQPRQQQHLEEHQSSNRDMNRDTKGSEFGQDNGTGSGTGSGTGQDQGQGHGNDGPSQSKVDKALEKLLG